MSLRDVWRGDGPQLGHILGCKCDGTVSLSNPTAYFGDLHELVAATPSQPNRAIREQLIFPTTHAYHRVGWSNYCFSHRRKNRLHSGCRSNRVQAEYLGGRLASLVHTDGPHLDFSYNNAGLIESISESASRTTSYSYDSNFLYLSSVTTSDGVTTAYTYQENGRKQTEGAILSIASEGNHSVI